MPPTNPKKTKKTSEPDDNDPVEVPTKTKGRKKQAAKAKGNSLTRGGGAPKGDTRTPESCDANTNVDPSTLPPKKRV